jgi:hypothetical protein
MRAYIDESYDVGPDGLHVLAALLAHDEDHELRATMLALRERWRGKAKLHFHDAEPGHSAAYLNALATVDRRRLVVLVQPRDRPERARRKAMERLLWELRGQFADIAIESRGHRQNRDDAVILMALQATVGRFRYEFPLGRDEPALWAADIVASGMFHAYGRDKRCILDCLGRVECHRLEAD